MSRKTSKSSKEPVKKDQLNDKSASKKKTSTKQENRKDIDQKNSIQEKKEEEFIVGDRFMVTKEMLPGHTLKSGACRWIRVGKDLSNNNQKVLVKMESLDISSPNEPPHLHIEYRIYKSLAKKANIPKVYWFGRTVSNFQVLVMQMLGPNLEQIFQMLQCQFSMKTMLLTGSAMLSGIRTVHESNIIHRNVKPESFHLAGLDPVSSRSIYITGFGLAKNYQPGNNDKRMANRILGPLRYMSINAHQGCEQTRRDDLESFSYILAYFLRQGNLPWIGFDTGTGSLEDLSQKILQCKSSVPIEMLFHGYPVEFAHFLRYVRTLDEDSEPDYEYLTQLFLELFKKEKFIDDGQFDWTNKLSDENNNSFLKK